MAKRNRSRSRNRRRTRRNRVNIYNPHRNPSRRRHVMHRRHNRRNPDTRFFMLGITAAIAGLVINFISPRISFLADTGITGAVKRIALGLIGRMAAGWAKVSGEIGDGIAIGGVVVGVNQVAGGLTGLLPTQLIPVMNQPPAAVAVPQSAVAAGGGVGRIVQLPSLVAQGGPGLSGIGAIRPLNRYAGYRTY